MPNCPQCQKPVDSQAVTCPYCNNQLKAFGHPGIPLYQSADNTFLCDRCTYDQDDSCNFPNRPHAKSCTLFHDYSQPLIIEKPTPASQKGWTGFKNRLYQYRALIAIALLIVVSVILAFNA